MELIVNQSNLDALKKILSLQVHAAANKVALAIKADLADQNFITKIDKSSDSFGDSGIVKMSIKGIKITESEEDAEKAKRFIEDYNVSIRQRDAITKKIK